MVAKGDLAAELHFFLPPMFRLKASEPLSLGPDNKIVYIAATVAYTESCVRAHWALWFTERGLAVKEWAFPRIDPHTVNDMRINYAQGSRQAELATVDGAEKRGVEGGGIAGKHSQCHRGIVS